MSLRALVFVALWLVVRSELVYKGQCVSGVYPKFFPNSNCQVTSVDVENCSHAPRFCRVGYGKRYPITVNFVPHFVSEKMMMRTIVNLKDDGTYSLMTTNTDVCEDHLMVCPLEPYVKQSLRFDLHVTEELSGSVPVLVNLFNAGNGTDSCCFTFKVKSMASNQH